jgi:hypothetical protein
LTEQPSSRAGRTYFDHPLIMESIQGLPLAIRYPSASDFREHVLEVLPQNSLKGRKRIARYLVQRFSVGGRMNLDLAAAIARFGDTRTSREVLYFELLRSLPLFLEIASLWLAELPEEGVPRAHLMSFLGPRLPGRSVEKVTKDSLTTMKQCGKLTSLKPAWFQAIWSPPPIEAFLYFLARTCPERTMVRVDLFAGTPLVRAMLWPATALDGLLRQAEEAGHISKISRLDQYHQFTLAASGDERMKMLLPDMEAAGRQQSQLGLFPDSKESWRVG